MKKLLLLIILSLCFSITASSEVLQLFGGFYIDDINIIQNRSGSIVFSYQNKQYKLHQQYILKASSEIPNNANCLDPENLDAYKLKADSVIQQYKVEQLQKKKEIIAPKEKPLTYSPANIKFGIGVGRDYGGFGLNWEAITSNNLGFYLGLGTGGVLNNTFLKAPPQGCLGTTIYFGRNGSAAIGTLSFSILNAVSASGYNSFSVFPAISGTLGAHIRLAQYVSFDISFGGAATFPVGSDQPDSEFSPALNVGISSIFPQVL